MATQAIIRNVSNGIYSINGSYDQTTLVLNQNPPTIDFNISLFNNDNTNLFINQNGINTDNQNVNNLLQQLLGNFSTISVRVVIPGTIQPGSKYLVVTGNIKTITTSFTSIGVGDINYITYNNNTPVALNSTTLNDFVNIFTNEGLLLVSNICFIKDTPITTDQGITKIQDITNQTINGLKVEHITEIIGSDNDLVCFEKDALYPGCPSERTVMTRNHKLSYNGSMVEADTLLNDKIYLVPYNGEKLYNVLLEENGTMYVNNMLCETLDVNNVIARFYKSKYTHEEKMKITKILNDNYDTPNYKIISALFFSNIQIR